VGEGPPQDFDSEGWLDAPLTPPQGQGPRWTGMRMHSLPIPSGLQPIVPRLRRFPPSQPSSIAPPVNRFPSEARVAIANALCNFLGGPMSHTTALLPSQDSSFGTSFFHPISFVPPNAYDDPPEHPVFPPASSPCETPPSSPHAPRARAPPPLPPLPPRALHPSDDFCPCSCCGDLPLFLRTARKREQISPSPLFTLHVVLSIAPHSLFNC